MELRKSAEQILSGTTLAEKLASPERITDDRPGPAPVTPAAPAMPGRPATPQFKPDAAPNVFVFNPFAEGWLAEGKTFNPAQSQAQLARDLENLPQFLCRQDDIVLTRRKPSVEFLSRIQQAGFPLPEFVEVDRSAGLRPGSAESGMRQHAGSETGAPRKRTVPEAGPSSAMPSILRSTVHPPQYCYGGRATEDRLRRTGAPALRQLAGRKLGSLRPWAWGPDSLARLRPLFASVTGETRAAASRFNPGLAQLYAKSWSADFLRKMLAEKAESGKRKAKTGWLCTENEVGVAVSSVDEALAAIAKIRARGQHNVVVKQSFGVAGSHALRLIEPELLATQLRWMEKAFARKRELVVEPWLERLRDFSAQLEMTAEGLKLCGFTGLVNDARGQFMANYAEPQHPTRLPTQVVSQFGEPAHISRRLLDFYGDLFARLEAELRAVDFLGPVGVDAFVYRAAGGGARLKPVVEINPRYTMGRVLVELMRQAGQDCAGLFRLVNAAQMRAEGCADFSGYARALEKKFPLRFAGETAPRIREGALCLNDPTRAQSCLAVFRVSRNLDELLEQSW